MKEVLIYGGGFNPPTRAHEVITQACLEIEGIDEVWLMPSGDRKDKHFNSRDKDRLLMLEAMREEVFSDDPRLKISHFELDSETRPTQTHKTVEALGQGYPDHHFQFVFGTDSYLNMHLWQRGKHLQKHLGMMIVPRGEIAIEPAPNVTILDVKTCPILSSTEVRSRVAEGLAIDHMVCQGVANYIKEHELYQLQ